MKVNTLRTTLLVLMVLVLTAGMVSPAAAGNLQKRKNDWRNIAIGAGALGVVGLLNHNSTEAIVGGLGAAYSASQYEHYRHRQSQARDWSRSYYRRHHRYHHRYSY